MPDDLQKPLYMFHTGEAHVKNFNALGVMHAAHVTLKHFVREDILADAIKLGYVSDAAKQTVFGIWHDMAKEGAIVINTCSTLGSLADEFNKISDVPMLRIDRPMIEQAVEHGQKIAVCATIECTLESSYNLLADEAQSQNKDIEIKKYFFEGLFEYYLNGEFDVYEQEIFKALQETSKQVDTIILTMASMAPAARGLASDIRVYTSPESGFKAAINIWGKQINGVVLND